MAIGKIITIDDKTWRVTRKVSGCFMMNGAEADLTDIHGCSNPSDLIDIESASLENYLHHPILGPLGSELKNMFRLGVDRIQKGKDNVIYSHIDAGYFTMAILFLRDPGKMRTLESGGTEWPLWQEKELSGYRIPLVDSSGKFLLEDICFGRAQWIKKEMWERFEYVRGENLYTENAAQEVIGIGREDFRKLAQPLELKLREYLNAPVLECKSTTP